MRTSHAKAECTVHTQWDGDNYMVCCKRLSINTFNRNGKQHSFSVWSILSVVPVNALHWLVVRDYVIGKFLHHVIN